jgi:5-(carboxyamino)imidazole ribonucleotide mutase
MVAANNNVYTALIDTTPVPRISPQKQILQISQNQIIMTTPQVSIIMGSTSDLPVMRKAADFLNSMEVPFEMLALSAHRTPDEVAEFAHNASTRGVKVIIAGAGMAAALPGVIAAITSLPVIGVPLSATLQGQDALLSIAQMPPGIPVATTGIDGAMNAAVLAVRILALSDSTLSQRYDAWRADLGKKIVKANAELREISYDFKTN